MKRRTFIKTAGLTTLGACLSGPIGQAIPALAAALLATGDAVLQQGNTWGDRYWGKDLRTGEGENHLGRLLMERRDLLRAAAA